MTTIYARAAFITLFAISATGAIAAPPKPPKPTPPTKPLPPTDPTAGGDYIRCIAAGNSTQFCDTLYRR